MRQTPLTRLRENYPAIVKELLGPLVEMLQAAHEVCDGDLEKFLILMLIALRTVEHRDFAQLDFAGISRGAVPVLPSLYSNVRSISETSRIPKETVRRKVAMLVKDGWVRRDGYKLSYTPLAAEKIAPVRLSALRHALVAHRVISGLLED